MNLLFNINSTNREFVFRNKFNEESHDFKSSEVQISLTPYDGGVYQFGEQHILVSSDVKLSEEYSHMKKIDCWLTVKNKSDFSIEYLQKFNIVNDNIGICFFNRRSNRLEIRFFLEDSSYREFLNILNQNTRVSSLSMVCDDFEYLNSESTNHRLKIGENEYPILELNHETMYGKNHSWELNVNSSSYVMMLTEMSVNILNN